jgi:hypothetical protein
MTTVSLTEVEMAQLRSANALLWRITDSHVPMCECILCTARWMTDVQDEESRFVPNVMLEDMDADTEKRVLDHSARRQPVK